jgi:parvulin-like peptidyl-prolyl isomerase
MLLVVAILLTVLFALGMVGLVAYKMDVNSRLINVITRVLPFPAATVNGHFITLNDYNFELAAWTKASASQGEDTDVSTLKSDVMEKMIYDEALTQLASKFRVKVTTEELDEALLEIAESDFGGEEQLKEQSETMFGWTVETFKDRLVYPYVLSNKLNESFANREDVVKVARDKAEKVLARLEAGEAFDTVAKEVSEDTASAESGGDIGWFAKGTTIAEFETAAYALQPGERSGLVKTSYGYHILLMVERGLPPATDGTPSKEAVTDENEQVHVKHILIRTQSFSEYLEKYIADSSVHRLIK